MLNNISGCGSSALQYAAFNSINDNTFLLWEVEGISSAIFDTSASYQQSPTLISWWSQVTLTRCTEIYGDYRSPCEMVCWGRMCMLVTSLRMHNYVSYSRTNGENLHIDFFLFVCEYMSYETYISQDNPLKFYNLFPMGS